MKSVQIRNIPPELLDALKQLAKANHRSLQGELHFILENAVKNTELKEDSGLYLTTVSTGKQSTFSREELYDDDER